MINLNVDFSTKLIISFVLFCLRMKWICYWTQVWLLATRKPILGGKEKLPYSGGQQPREKVDSCPRTNSEDSAGPWKFLKGEGEVNHLRRASEFVIFHCVQVFSWFVGGEVKGWCSRNLVLSSKLPSFSLDGGLSSCRRTQRYCYAYSLRGNQDTALSLHYCFLTAPPLFCIPSLPLV